MTRRTPQTMELGRQILQSELAQGETPEELAIAWEHCCHRLYAALVNLVGEAGFSALLHRAAQLTKPTVAWIELVLQPEPQSVPVRELVELARRSGVPHALDSLSILLANFLSLLCSFIGEDLTLRLVRRTWSKVWQEPAASFPIEGK